LFADILQGKCPTISLKIFSNAQRGVTCEVETLKGIAW